MAKSFQQKLSYLLTFFSGVAVLAMMLHICADVISRNFFQAPVPATLEFVTYLYMVSSVFLPLALTQYERGHVIVEVFTANLSPRRIAAIDFIALLLCFIYIAFLGWFAMLEAIRATARDEVITLYGVDLALWPTRWLVPLGFGGMAIVQLMQILAFLTGDRDGHKATSVGH